MALEINQTSAYNTPTLATSTTVLAANPNRKGWQIQNQDTNPLKIALGATASSTVYHMVLKACGSAADGTGGSFSELDGVIFNGVVTCYSAGTPSYTVLEHGSSQG